MLRATRTGNPAERGRTSAGDAARRRRQQRRWRSCSPTATAPTAAIQEVDSGQFDDAGEVFAACGNGMAMRTATGRASSAGSTTTSSSTTRTPTCRGGSGARGWPIRYEPGRRAASPARGQHEEWSPLFMFHVDRNRLLMLTKDATAGLAAPLGRSLPADLRVDRVARRPAGDRGPAPPGGPSDAAAAARDRLVPPLAAAHAAPTPGDRAACHAVPRRSSNVAGEGAMRAACTTASGIRWVAVSGTAGMIAEVLSQGRCRSTCSGTPSRLAMTLGEHLGLDLSR